VPLTGDPVEVIDNGVVSWTGGLYGTPSACVEGTLPDLTTNDIDLGQALIDTLYCSIILGFYLPTSSQNQFTGRGTLYTLYPFVYEFFRDMPALTVDDYSILNDMYMDRVRMASMLSTAISPLLFRSKATTDAFVAAFKKNESIIGNILEKYSGKSVSFPYLTEADGLEALRTGVLEVVKTVLPASTFRGIPPNWYSWGVNVLIPGEFWELLRTLEAEALSLASAFSGPVDDILSFIELCEQRIIQLNNLIAFLERLITFLKTLTIPNAYFLYVPYGAGGIDYITKSMLEATGGPAENPANYTAGMVATSGVPSVIFDLIAGQYTP
jgi:hypothetical protein